MAHAAATIGRGSDSDSILAASGALDLEAGGPGIFPEVDPGLIEGSPKGAGYQRWPVTKDGPEVWRRSIYVTQMRTITPPVLDLFDPPDKLASCPERTTTTVPTQALQLLNSRFVSRQAAILADRVANEAGRDPWRQIERAFLLSLSRLPRPTESQESLGFLGRQQSYHSRHNQAPEAVDLSRETAATKKLYGLDDPNSGHFGRNCLLARRLVERGVRFVQLFGGANAADSWDGHTKLEENHRKRAAAVDKPIRGLLKDLKSRGLLDSTLVVWHSEFGRLPISQFVDGRDHNPYGFSIWMAGGGAKGGEVVGATDEFGYEAVEEPHTIHDFHATILHFLGLDHTRLTYFHSGREHRLTDVAGEVIHKIVA